MILPSLVWKPSPNFSSRQGERITRLVLHDCQGSYYGSINTFLGNNGGNPVSAHFVLKEDGSEVTQMVDLADKAWHACNANPYSIGVEMAGFAERGFPDAELDAAARIFAFLCKFMNIPVKHALGVYEAGISSHFDLGKFGGGHADPSTNPMFMGAFVSRVAAIQAVAQTWPGLRGGRGPATPTGAFPTGPLSLDFLSICGVQRGLNAIGEALLVDGKFGPATKDALRKALQ